MCGKLNTYKCSMHVKLG